MGLPLEEKKAWKKLNCLKTYIGWGGDKYSRTFFLEYFNLGQKGNFGIAWTWSLTIFKVWSAIFCILLPYLPSSLQFRFKICTIYTFLYSFYKLFRVHQSFVKCVFAQQIAFNAIFINRSFIIYWMLREKVLFFLSST